MGKIPKAFKIIPNLKNWEDVLHMTDPDSWSPHAMYQVRRAAGRLLRTRHVCTHTRSHARARTHSRAPSRARAGH